MTVHDEFSTARSAAPATARIAASVLALIAVSACVRADPHNALDTATERALFQLVHAGSAEQLTAAPRKKLAYRVLIDGQCSNYDRGAYPSLERDALNSVTREFYGQLHVTGALEGHEIGTISECQPAPSSGALTVNLHSRPSSQLLDSGTTKVSPNEISHVRRAGGRAVCRIVVQILENRVASVEVDLHRPSSWTPIENHVEELACIAAATYAHIGLVGAVRAPTYSLLEKVFLPFVETAATDVTRISPLVVLYYRAVPEPGSSFRDYWQSLRSSDWYQIHSAATSENTAEIEDYLTYLESIYRED